jgi:hypothetical protein
MASNEVRILTSNIKNLEGGSLIGVTSLYIRKDILKTTINILKLYSLEINEIWTR